MPKAEDISSTDGLEILSVGSLYDGPWDKKYWSSSRGKDRYPYPVGYCALQTHNGIKYKMEILEGSSGPLFQITSSDGHSGSGQTPDIAWVAFQRKTSRIKLLHAKRFSCKVDGVEFFGFKNTLVQRLLRELLSNLDQASEQTSPSIRSPATAGDIPLADLPKNPNLQSHLTKSRFTGKRSKKCKTKNVSSAPTPDNRKVQIHEKVDKQVLASSWRKEYAICNSFQDLPSKANLNCHQDHFTSVADLSCEPYQSSSHCEDNCYSVQLERQHLEDGNNLQSAPINSENIEETLNVLQLDILKCLDKVQIVDPPVQSEHKLPISDTVNDSEVVDDSEITKTSLLYAPDTLDTQKEDSLSPNITSTEELCKTKDELAADNALTFIEPAGESCPEEETYNDSAYSDFDSVGREAVKSMMEILLPQAVPLFTYSRKRKKRKHNPSKESSSTMMTSIENDKIYPLVDEISYGEVDGNSISDLEMKEDHVQNRYLGSTVQSEIIAVVPDSIEEYRCEAELANQVKSLACFNASVEANSAKDNSSADKRQMFSNLNSTVESGVCKRKLSLQKDADTYQKENHNSATSSLEKPTVSECLPDYQFVADVVNHKQQISFPSHLITNKLAADKLLENHAPKPASPVSRTYHNGMEAQKSMDNCSNRDCTSGIKSLVKIGESVAASSDAGQIQIQINALGLFKPQSMSEEQCTRAETHGPGNSNLCQSSHVDMCSRSYKGPLSESIIYRNVEDGSLVEEEGSLVNSENKDAVPDTSSPRRNICYLLDNNMHEEDTSNMLERNALLMGCYSHQKRISAVMLKIEIDDIYVCTSCGLQEENERDLFLYKLCMKDPSSLGRPYFIGHSTFILPISNDVCGREVSVETSALQFTPDARALVMLDSIQVPYCSERRYLCPCSTCASASFEDNAVKVVQLNKGYVSLLVKLKTHYPVNSVLVCEPDCLVALDESGALYLWFMNPEWSASTEDCVIQSYSYVASRVVELKRIPRSSSLLLGHNGCGDFSLWDIRRRSFLSRFSAPASSILGYIPISIFNWQNGDAYGDNGVEKCNDELISAANTWLIELDVERIFKGEDIGVWILARTSSDSYGQPGFEPSNSEKSVGSWRLALLVNNVVIMGTSYPRCSAIGVSGGQGILGTGEGTAYMWDLKDGNKVEILHSFKGVGVSHIATNDSAPHVTAVAGDSGQLWIYKHL